MSTTTTKKPLNVGDVITYTTNGHTITVQRTQFTYTVTVHIGEPFTGAYRIDPLCRTYATEIEARHVARSYALMYKAQAAAAKYATATANLN